MEFLVPKLVEDIDARERGVKATLSQLILLLTSNLDIRSALTAAIFSLFFYALMLYLCWHYDFPKAHVLLIKPNTVDSRFLFY